MFLLSKKNDSTNVMGKCDIGINTSFSVPILQTQNRLYIYCILLKKFFQH